MCSYLIWKGHFEATVGRTCLHFSPGGWQRPRKTVARQIYSSQLQQQLRLCSQELAFNKPDLSKCNQQQLALNFNATAWHQKSALRKLLAARLAFIPAQELGRVPERWFSDKSNSVSCSNSQDPWMHTLVLSTHDTSKCCQQQLAFSGLCASKWHIEFEGNC